MERQDFPVIAEVDVAIVGGGLAGVAAALESAASGRDTLLIEARPLLGWEATSAFALEWPGAEEDAEAFPAAVRSAGGARGSRLDAPICELVLERLVAASGAEILFYSTPVAIWRDGDRIGGLVIGNKSGRQIVRARAFIDATEEALLWRLAGTLPAGPERVRGRLALFYNHVSGDLTKLSLPTVPGVGALRLLPSVWPGEVAIEFEGEAPADGWGAPNALVRSLRRQIPAVARALRDAVPAFSEALLTHTGREPFPVTGLALGMDAAHPEIRNLFGAGAWLVDATGRPDAGELPARWRMGKDVGARVAQWVGDAPLPGLPPAGPSPAATEAEACDVLVVGGGTAGAFAAIAAGREGAKVTLLEASHFLGGIGAGGGIHIYYHGFAGGIQDEVDSRTNALSDLFGANQRLTGFHPDAKQVVLEEMAAEAGVNVIYRSALIEARTSGGRVEVAEVASPTGAILYPAAAFVDGTGDADLAAMAGAEFQLGRERDGLSHHFSQAYQILDANGSIRLANFDAGYVVATDVTDLTRARRLGLKHLWRDTYTAENRLLTIAPLLGLRQSRQIVGDYVLTLDDQISGRRFPDVISYAKAHYDNHAFDYENESDEAALWVWLLGAWHDPFASEVPYRCLLPKGIEGLLVACRALSLTHDAHMMFRMQRDLQRVGEVAGVAAAMAVKEGTTPRQVDVRRLQEKLLRSGILREEPVVSEASGTVEGWIAALDAPQPKEAVWQLAHAGEEVIEPLRDVLKNGSERARFWAAVALAMHGRPEAAPELLRCLIERADVKPEGYRTVPFWQSVVVLLGRIGDPAAVPEIARLLEEPETTLDGLITAIRALGRIGDPQAVPAIQAMLARSDLPTERPFQVSTGGRSGVSDDARWALELAAAETLAMLGAPNASLAEKHLSDPRAYVRRYAERVRRMSLVPIGF